MLKKKWLPEIVLVLMIIITLIMLYIANTKMIFQMDDLYYGTNLVTGETLSSADDIVESQIWHYFNWGGRTIAHTLLQITLALGTEFADISNVILTSFLAFLICKIAGKSSKSNWILAISLLVLLNANWGQTLLWQSGVANYIYTTIFILLFLYQYLKILEDSQIKLTRSIIVWIIPLGLFSGWSNENMGPAVFVVSLGIIAYHYWKTKKIPIWMVLGNISCLAGSLFVILAPGNQVRIVENFHEVTYGWKMKVFLRFNQMGIALFQYLFPTILVLLILLFVYCFILKLSLRKTDLVLMAAGVLSYGAMILSPHYPDRATFGTLVFFICTILHLLSTILEQRKDLVIGRNVILLFCWLATNFIFMEYLIQVLEWV